MVDPLRLCIALVIAPAAAQAWTFTPDPVCTIFHETEAGRLSITYDPTQDRAYALDLVTVAPLPQGPVFALDFGGFAISTTRHAQSGDGRGLTVTDNGFGNVLSGLSAGTGARAMIGDAAIAFPTEDAAPAVEAFRRCPEATLS